MAKESKLTDLTKAIVADDIAVFEKILRESPSVAAEAVLGGATRENPKEFFVEELKHYIYAGDTLLHVAAMGHRADMLELLVKCGASVAARNRRGAEPLHYAADGNPSLSIQERQYSTVVKLIALGAAANALDKSGVAPLHRAVRQRCTGAVSALIACGADVNLKNKSGSTPLILAHLTTGRGGSGSVEAKREQQKIIELLIAAGAKK